VTKTSTTTKATRTYTFNGELIATRTPTGLHYTGADQQNSVQASVIPGASTPDNTQAYDPYGQKRGTGTFDTQRGWLGEIDDTTTKLSYLNARYYDPNIGRFISPDPVVDTNNPTALNPYTYGNNNPTTDADPSGEWIPITNYGHGNGGYNSEWKPATNRRNINTARKVARFVREYKRYGASAGDSRRRPAPAYVSAQAQALHEIAAMQTSNAEAYQALAGLAALNGMRSTNLDPAFWKALASAGSAHNLRLLGRLHDRQIKAGQERMLRIEQDAAASAQPSSDSGGGGAAGDGAA
jgi:RHS repeat-associated protein